MNETPLRAMYVYAWDLLDEGTAEVAGRLRDAGLNSLALATAYHAGKFIRPHAPGRKVWFPEDGTVYFRPDAAGYGRLVPQAARILDDFDPLAAIARDAPDFHCTGWTVGLHNSRLGTLHPDLCSQTPYGDPLVNALCPSQPEVRDYLVNLCKDISRNSRIDEIAVETPGFQTYRHGHHHEFELIDLTPAAEMLLEACFCPACSDMARKAGIDADALAQQARRDLDRFFEDGSAPAADPRTDPDWAAFHACRGANVTSLVQEVRAAMHPSATLSVIPTVQSPNSLCWREGSDLAALAAAADRLEVPAYQTGPRAIAEDMDQTRKSAGDQAKMGFILRPTWPNITGPNTSAPAQLRESVRAAGDAGADRISFYNYGHMRLQSLDWIAAAFG